MIRAAANTGSDILVVVLSWLVAHLHAAVTLTPLFNERELAFTFVICRRASVCLSSVCNVRAPYSGY